MRDFISYMKADMTTPQNHYCVNCGQVIPPKEYEGRQMKCPGCKTIGGILDKDTYNNMVAIGKIDANMLDTNHM